MTDTMAFGGNITALPVLFLLHGLTLQIWKCDILDSWVVFLEGFFSTGTSASRFLLIALDWTVTVMFRLFVCKLYPSTSPASAAAMTVKAGVPICQLCPWWI